MTSQARHSRFDWIGSYFLRFGILATLMMAWTLMLPIHGVADEQAHITQAVAVAHGQIHPVPINELPEELQPSGKPGAHPSNFSKIPSSIATIVNSAKCYVWDSNTDSSCVPTISDTGASEPLVLVYNPASNYPVMYYAAVGWPSLLFGGTEAVWAIRIMSTILSALVLALGWFWLARALPKRTTAPLVLLVLPPTFWALSGVNPQGIEISILFALGSCLAALLIARINSRHLLLSIGVLGALLAHARPSSLIWVAIVGIVAIILLDGQRWRDLRKNPYMWSAVALIGISSALALLWILAADPADSLMGATTDLTLGSLIDSTLTLTRSYAVQTVAVAGWLDVVLSQKVVFAVVVLWIGVILAAQRKATTRQYWALLVMILAYLLAPIVLQYPQLKTVGIIWQGRYSLGILTCLLVFALVIVLKKASSCARWIRIGAIGSLLVFGLCLQFALFERAMYRFSVGVDAGVSHLGVLVSPENRVATALFVIAALAFVAMTIGDGIRARTADEIVTTPLPESSNEETLPLSRGEISSAEHNENPMSADLAAVESRSPSHLATSDEK